MAVPGLIEGHRVVKASNLGWYDIDPADELGLPGRPIVVANDAEAAASASGTRGRPPGRLAFIGLGTGVGGAIVEEGVVIGSNRFAHGTPYSDRPCVCGAVGCLGRGGWLGAPTRARAGRHRDDGRTARGSDRG
ncbi:MAG: ROK family protein [Ilumatobacteraceae bacterium]